MRLDSRFRRAVLAFGGMSLAVVAAACERDSIGEAHETRDLRPAVGPRITGRQPAPPRPPGKSARPRGSTETLKDGLAAYTVLPPGDAAVPTLIVLHSGKGLTDDVKRGADAFADRGYAAIAPDLYHGTVAETRQEAGRLMDEVNVEHFKRVIGGVEQHIRERPRMSDSTWGVVGWCLGGRWALEAAMHAPELDAVVSYYGYVETDRDAYRALDTPVLAVFGTLDQVVPIYRAKAFEESLDGLGVPHRVLYYEAHHGFANPTSPHYDADAAGEAWAWTMDFLDAKLAHAD